jgi:hypothetical protein
VRSSRSWIASGHKSAVASQARLFYCPLYLVRCIAWIGGIKFQHAGIIAQVVQAVPSWLNRLGEGEASLQGFNMEEPPVIDGTSLLSVPAVELSVQ